MTENDPRKSMDDVLASIRKIVKAEREAGGAEPVEEAVPFDGDAPLALTVDMMSSQSQPDPVHDVLEAPVGGDEAGDARPRAADIATYVSAPDPIEAAPVELAPEPVPQPAPTPALDADSLRALVREVIREELSSGEAEGLVRQIITTELTTGAVGANISRNVLRLIRNEIAKSQE